MKISTITNSAMQYGTKTILMSALFLLIVMSGNAKMNGINHTKGIAGSKSATGTIRVNISKGSPLSMIDGVLTLYNNAFSDSVVNGEDASKLWGNEENIAILRDGNYLSMEARKVMGLTDTTFLYLNKMLNNTGYSFAITGEGLPLTVSGFLVDQYTSTQTPLDLLITTNIAFNTDNNAGSISSSRFMLIFTNTNPLSVSNIQLKAAVKLKSVLISWKSATEKNVDHYEIQRNNEVNLYNKVTTVVADNMDNSTYSYTDNMAVNGDNYYRIKAVSKDGTIQYSSIAKVTIGDKLEGINVYPNPIVSKQVNLMLMNLEAGNYNLGMYNSAGQLVMAQKLQHAGGSITTNIQLSGNLPMGVYQLRLAGADNNYVQTVIVQ